MHFTKKSSYEKRIELRNRLKKQKILKFPGAYNPLTAKLISEIGFDEVGFLENCVSFEGGCSVEELV